MNTKEAPPAQHSSALTKKIIPYFFDRFAAHITKWAGSPLAFGLAISLVLIWVIAGPLYDFSETWQLVINTGTTIITFLMVFLIQQSQNKDSQALHLKLDELLIALKDADARLVDSENLDEEKLRILADECRAKAKSAILRTADPAPQQKTDCHEDK